MFHSFKSIGEHTLSFPCLFASFRYIVTSKRLCLKPNHNVTKNGLKIILLLLPWPLVLHCVHRALASKTGHLLLANVAFNFIFTGMFM